MHNLLQPAHSKISLREPWEIDYWTRELGASKSELERVVIKVGNSTAAVRKELRLPQPFVIAALPIFAVRLRS